MPDKPLKQEDESYMYDLNSECCSCHLQAPCPFCERGGNSDDDPEEENEGDN